ncbi:MAG: beta-ketoacyl-ACP synthase III [Gemmatimonadales bacterium]
MTTARIVGTGHAVPDRIVTNDELAGVMDTSDEWIRTRTGIRERRWIRPGETGLELARRASTRAIEMAGLAASDLDAIVYASISSDHFLPGNGVLLQHALGMGTRPAFDVRQQCAGFVYAVAMADALIRSGLYRKLLVVGQELQSTRMDLSDRGRNTAVLFADGAGAVVMVASEVADRGVLSVDLHADGAHMEKLWVDEPGALHNPVVSEARYAEGRYFVQMDGREVFRHAVTRMPESVRACLSAIGREPAEVDLLIPHQANLRISEAVQKQLGLRDDQVMNNIERYGNTTAATIPIALDECVRAGRLQDGDLLVLTAFGSGFVWGSTAIRW